MRLGLWIVALMMWSISALAQHSIAIANANVNSEYTFSLAHLVKGGTPPLHFALPAATKLPPGLTLSSDGTISGKASSPQEQPYVFDVMVTDSGKPPMTARQKLELRVLPEQLHFLSGDTSQSDKLPAGDAAPVADPSSDPPPTPAAPIHLATSQDPAPASANTSSPAAAASSNSKAAAALSGQAGGKNQTPKTITLVKPKILQQLDDGAASATILATPTTTDTGTDKVSLLSVQKQTDPCDLDHGTPLPLLDTNKNVVTSVATDNTGLANLALKRPLMGGDFICAFQTFTPKVATEKEASGQPHGSDVMPVTAMLDWGRVRAYFLGGVLIANNQNSFSSSSASEFLAFNLEKSWLLAGCSLLDPQNGDGSAKCQKGGRFPGISSFFETRLTAIPIKPASATTTASSLTSSQSLTSIGGQLSSQKTARLGVGFYFPIIFTHWYSQDQPYGLFVAPLLKIGFDTLTGPVSQANITTTASTQLTTQVNFNRFYNYWNYGVRIGHYGLSSSRSKAPKLFSYLDVGLGPYSNLSSFVCQPVPVGKVPKTLPGSNCGVYFPSVNGAVQAIDSAKRVYRLDLEGILQVPQTPFFIGFNANVGQKLFGANRLDVGLQPNDDLRFVFGVKLDVGAVLQKLGVPSK